MIIRLSPLRRSKINSPCFDPDKALVVFYTPTPQNQYRKACLAKHPNSDPCQRKSQQILGKLLPREAAKGMQEQLINSQIREMKGGGMPGFSSHLGEM